MCRCLQSSQCRVSVSLWAAAHNVLMKSLFPLQCWLLPWRCTQWEEERVKSANLVMGPPSPPPLLQPYTPPPPRPFPQEQRTLPGHEALLHFFLFFIRGGEEEEEAKPSLLLFKVVWTLTFWNVTHTGKLQLVVRHVVFFFSLLLYSKVR